MKTDRESIERHLDVSHNHEAGLIPVATAILLRALLAENEALRGERDRWSCRHDAEKARAEAAEAALAWLRNEINEASDPDFLFGAMDNVSDMDTTLDDYADAASRAIRAATIARSVKDG